MFEYSSPLLLAKKLISLPSFVDDQQDERPVVEFLNNYLKIVFPTMVIEKQYIRKSPRYNLILRGMNKPKMVVVGHVDTVQPTAGWKTDPLNPTLKQGRLYGLGAADMKSSLAAFLYSLIKEKDVLNLQELLVLMYVDEEYDFLGLKRFVASKYLRDLKPDIILSLDGAPESANACRGLIEIELLIKGRGGHAADPANGVNAITNTLAVIEELSKQLGEYSSEILGPSTLNFAFMQGGASTSVNKKEILWLRQGNLIPDMAKVILEIRPASSKVNSSFVKNRLRRLLEQRGLRLQKYIVRHDFAPWLPSETELGLDIRSTYEKAGLHFKKSDLSLKGYLDVQLLAEKVSSPTFVIGTGGFNKHGPNECVPVRNVNQAADLYRELLKEILR
jgi:succinyl-diaminopimelate desuccinylase